MKHYIGKFILIFAIVLIIGALVLGVVFGGAILGFWGNTDAIDADMLSMRQNSSIVYIDPDTGQEVEMAHLSAKENREWVSLDKIPVNLQNAFVAIEDERFYDHKGYDLPRTIKATGTWIWKKVTRQGGAASLGGSTITQQLIKNLTGEDEQTAGRKIQEISRAVALEKEMSKEQILEMYLNCIYLSQGCNGVQTAAKRYFNKDVSELTLAECASIAGITQYPALYDPLVHPDANKERQEMVLSKMLELDYITQSQYDQAINQVLKFEGASVKEEKDSTDVQSYFADQVIQDVIRDLRNRGYSETLAHRMLYSGGVKVYATYQPKMQKAVEEYYENVKNFPDKRAQSAIAVVDVKTGEVVGIAGGIGSKEGSLTLNRASMSPRQPGSSIKPIAVYAPAIDNGTIYPGSVFKDEAKTYDGWTPRNSDNQYRGMVDLRRAVRTSLNTVPVEVLSRMSAQSSFDYLRDKMNISTLVEARNVNGDVFTDIGYSQLALGGLTDGMTAVELAAAYATFANGGIYNEPYTYSKVVDKDGAVILTPEHKSWKAMEPSTAYIMSQLLREVVTSGTGVGAQLSNGVFTAGKTGTTTENKDRWFVGFTPYYSAAVWYGYDIPEYISMSSNPCVPVFRNVMDKVHSLSKAEKREITKPDDVTSVSYCLYTGMRATNSCPATSYYCGTEHIPGYCDHKHSGQMASADDEKDKDEDEDEEKSTRKADAEDEDGENTRTTARQSGNASTGGGQSTTRSSGNQTTSGGNRTSTAGGGELEE